MSRFNDDDLADYDDDEYWEEAEEEVVVKKIPVKPAVAPQSVKTPLVPQLAKAPSTSPLVVPDPSPSIGDSGNDRGTGLSGLSGLTTSQIAKLTSTRSSLNVPFTPSSWWVDKCMRSPELVDSSTATCDSADTVFVVIGHVDAGKSTLMAQLVSRFGQDSSGGTGGSPRHKPAGSKPAGKSRSLAWDMDVGADEREHGVTIDAKSKRLVVGGRSFVAIDAPGHADYVPSMLLGAMQADAALLVIDCGKFDSGFSRGGQTKEHVTLIRSLGVRQLIVVLNKIDVLSDVEDELATIQCQLEDFIFSEMNFSRKNVTFVPVSAAQAINLFSPAQVDGQDAPLSLESALLQLQAGKKLIDGQKLFLHRSVCVPVVDVNGDHFSGRIECGSIHHGEKLLALPSKQLVTVKLVPHGASKPVPLGPGSYLESIEFTLADATQPAASVLFPGSVLVDPVFPLENLKVTDTFIAHVLVINDDLMPIVKGQSVTINVHTAMVDGVVAKLLAKEKVGEAGTILQKNPKCLVKGEKAYVEISTRRNVLLCVEPDEPTRVTGRVIVRDRGVTIAAGLIVSQLG